MKQHTWRFVDVRDACVNDGANAALCCLLSYSIYQPTADKIKDRLASYQSPNTYIYACTDGNTYLGLIVYHLSEKNATILDIAVRDDMRGQGVGTFLIDGLIQTTRTTEVLAETDDDAVRFYQKYGFKVTPIQTAYDCKRYLCRYMPLEIKAITRDNWRRVMSKSFRYAEKTYGDFRCVVGLLTIDEVTSPLKRTMFDKELVLVDKGYHWLQIAPEGESWWLTVMIDPNDNVVQYYYDITDRNILDGEHSRFYDLFLDVVVLPDGNATIFDKDELDAALKDGIITNTQHQKAVETANRLFREVSSRLNELNIFVGELYKEMNYHMTQQERKQLVTSYLGKTVTIEIDRPIGAVHPKHPDLIYPINYGFIPGVLGGDGEELDVYLLGVDTPQEIYTAQIIGIVYRRNDVEDKLVAAPIGVKYTKEEIADVVHFQEQYYDSFVVVEE